MTDKKKPSGPKPPNPAFAWLLDYMERHPEAVYADAAAMATKAGHKVFPIMWGRAQMLLGRVKAKPRGQGKAATKKAARERKQAANASEAAAPPARPSAPRRAPTFQRTAHLPVADGDLDLARDFVERINDGHRAVLLYDGESWVLAVE